MLVICDFDGTVTARDTNSFLASRFARAARAALEGKLASRELSVRDVLAAEFEPISAPLEELVAATDEVPVRPGFERMVDAVRARGGDVVLLSSGFRQLIEPILAREGLLELVELHANDIRFEGGRGRITWRDLPMCALCGEHCKRHEVGLLRAGGGGPLHEQVVFVGDGFSDRCGAEAADRIFARDSLAGWLDAQGVAHETWGDFDDVRGALGAAAPE